MTTIYSISHCKFMIARYEAEASNWTKPARWHELARLSAATWRQHLERAEAA